MSEPTPFVRRYSYRHSVETLAAALAIGAVCVALAASGTPGSVTAQGLGSSDEDIDAMNKAFRDYLKSIKEMQKSFLGAEAFALDDAHAVGAYDLITAFIHSANRNNLTSSGSGRRGYPRFAGFDDPDTRIGVDNPDTQYMGTIVINSDCQGVWRIWGNRTNTADFILTTFDTSAGSGGGPTLEDEDMVIDPDGSFEVYASCPALRDPAWENWLELIPAETLQIARRQSMCDWNTEAPGAIHIERVGTEGVPSAPLSPEVMTQQIYDGIALNEVQAPFWPAFIDTIKQIPVNTATPWRPTGGLGITTQLSMLMWFDLEDHEALIIRLPDEDYAKYYGLQLSNMWGSSADWGNRHVSMSWGLDDSCQGELSQPTFHPAQQAIIQAGGGFCGQQDAYFIVLSKQDPGVQNWIETAELSQGILAGRLQSVDPADMPDIVGVSCALPVAIKVPVAGVKPTLQALGASFTDYDETDRADQLRVRQLYQKNKYVFW
jgi:hypothetical protein